MKVLLHANAQNLIKLHREEHMMLWGFKEVEGLDVEPTINLKPRAGSVYDYVVSYKAPFFPSDYSEYFDSNTKYVYFYPDIRNEPNERLLEILENYDMLLVVDKGSIPQFQEALPHIEVRQLRQGVHPLFYHSVFPYNPERAKWNWLFAGSPYQGREEFVKNLLEVERGVIFGNEWQQLPSVPQWKSVDIYNEELAMQICKSILTLNYNAFSQFREAYSVRIYKTMASGGVLFTNAQLGFDDVFTPNKHYLEYRDFDEMKIILDNPLELFDADELRTISENAKKEVLENHTYEQRGKELCNLLKNLK